MSELPTKPLFSLHRSDGTVEHGLSAQELSNRILDGSVTEIDFISAAGGAPRPFWQFREFAPLSTRLRKPSSPGAAAQPSASSATAQHSAAARPAISLGSVSRVTPALSQPSSASSASNAAQSRTSTNPRITAKPARLFADNLLKVRPPQFRTRLLDCSLPDIVGAAIDEAPEAIAQAT